jgi:hypothetical protein
MRRISIFNLSVATLTIAACGGGSGRPADDADSIGTVASGTTEHTSVDDTGTSTAQTTSVVDDTTDTGDDVSADDDSPVKFDLGEIPTFCTNLECDQVVCADPTVTTTVSGTVYDPSATLPLYNVQVYIPNAPVGPIPDDLTCDQCDAELSGSPLVSTITDTQGNFVLPNAPVGVDIPLVMQVGKWRRQVTIPAIQACQDNPIVDPQVTRLPRSSAEGNLPRIALTTGSADPLFCLLRRLGIDDSEYGIMNDDARIHFYRGVTGSTSYNAGFGATPGAVFPLATETLWDSGWEDYDIVMLSCEASTYPTQKDTHRVKLRDYIDTGGRVFATHFHYTWMTGDDAPADLASVADFKTNWSNVTDIVDIDQSFPKGEALADWLAFVDGTSPHGRFQVSQGRDHTNWIVQALAQRWVTYGPAEQIMYFTFNAPIGAPEEEQCGRMVYSDIHVSTGAGSATASFPSACNDSELTEQEKVLIFMLFDLSACIHPDDKPPPG